MKLLNENLLDVVPASEQNGCGPRFFGWAARDKWGSVNFKKAGDIHDSHYYIVDLFLNGSDDETKLNFFTEYLCLYNMEFLWFLSSWNVDDVVEYSNRVFLYNLNMLNKHESMSLTGYFLRKIVIAFYYSMVKKYGKYYVSSLK
jgi:hypothetical protein